MTMIFITTVIVMLVFTAAGMAAVNYYDSMIKY